MIQKRLKLDEKVQLNSCKVEIRKLPPLLKPLDFYKTIEQSLEDVFSKYYIQGKIKEREKVYSRCYLVFITEQKMRQFLNDYKKIFCDERGSYYKPEIKKSLNQNYTNNLISTPNPAENSYLDSSVYKKFLERVTTQQSEAVKLGDFERKPGQAIQEDKSKKFEKVKTAIIAELESDYLEEKKRQLEIEQMQKNVITTQDQISKAGEKRRRFIFVPKARD